MTQTSSGAKQAAQKILQRDPLHYAKIGAKGGKKTGIVKGFAAMTEEKRREAGRLGGSISRRGRKEVKQQ
jgi:general stress protein YciG